ncbi:MAG: leucyl aminopeptidase [Chlamydiae bacterium]|nr:leucyl aminopeptidase [Chlamydiota bacterium]
MKITSSKDFESRNEADFLILPFCEDKKAVALYKIAHLDPHIHEPIHFKDFGGKNKECSLIYIKKEKEPRILLLGLGKPDKITSESIRCAYSEAIKICKKKNGKKINIIFPHGCNVEEEELIRAISESLLLTNYSFDSLKHDSIKEDNVSVIESVDIIGLKPAKMDLVSKVKVICEGVNFARDLVNTNADEMTPHELSIAAKELSKVSQKIKVRVFDKKKIEEEKMGLLLAVNKGSHKEPAFILVNYQGNPGSKDHTVFIGKGITYDTGGRSLKPTTSMETMKSDMSGAALVLAAIYTAAKLELKVNLTSVVSATENAIGPNSYKPGDVYKSLAGKTVEVTNTDAEGRLILADALTYVVKNLKPSRMIDLATLTGGVVVALGEEISGLFCNNKELSDKLELSSKRTSELLWKMPLHQPYKKLMKSDIGDIKNSINSSKASSIMGALFLEEFISEDIPWAHIDIAGTSFTTKPQDYNPTNATGFGLRLLIDFLSHLS